MGNQNLFESLQRICDFTALQSEMFEIIDAVKKDKYKTSETKTVDMYMDEIQQLKIEIEIREMEMNKILFKPIGEETNR